MKRILSFLSLAAIAAAQRGDDRPNFVVFVMDDLPFLEQWEESAPKGRSLEGLTITLDPYYTPRIDEFREEAVIFAKSYCAAPKCAPSRMCLLTGRQAVSCEAAIEATLKESRGTSRSTGTSLSSGIYGTGVTVMTMKMQGKDAQYNLPQMMRSHGYYTGLIGKWHMMPDDDMGHPDYDCQALELFPDEDKYAECKDLLKDVGFDYIEGFYYGNIKSNSYFSHNPEWMVNEAANFVGEAVARDEPFFMYFASTLTHSPDADQALARFDVSDTPKGKLVGQADDPEGKTSMDSRAQVLADAQQIAQDRGLSERTTAAIYWADMQFGALIDALKRYNVYDNTYVVFQNDHGQDAKGLLYEQGTRILNFHRYPPLYGKDGPMILPEDFVTSNIDIAASIFHLAEIDLPDEYQLDGESFINDVQRALTDPDFDQVEDGEGSCRFKFMDIKNSYSMISGRYQYIFRATADVDTMYNVDELYPYSWDLEQLYDLETDPNQKKNIFNNPSQLINQVPDVVAEFQTIMREYIDLHCIATNGAQCVKPDLDFGLEGGGYFVDVPDETPAPVTDVVVDPCFPNEPNAGSQCCDDSDCDADKAQTCDLGFCVDPPCDCDADEICVAGICTPFSPPATTPECTDSDDCANDETCMMNECVPVLPMTPAPTFQCTQDSDCAQNEFCMDNMCLHGDPATPAPTFECSDDSDCAQNEFCMDNTCLHGDPETPTPVIAEPVDPCAGVTCRGSQVCKEGVCTRPTRAPRDTGSSSGSSGSSGSSDCPTECCSTDDCRGPKVCNSAGVCERASSSSGSSGSTGTRGNGGSRGGGRGGVKSAKQMESLAFDGGVETETENVSGFSFDFESLKSMTVSVSTLLMFVLVAITMWIGRSCFWKMYGQKKETTNGLSNYGAV